MLVKCVVFQTPGGDDVISELESARLKLATLKIREKLDNVGHLEDIEDKLAAHQVYEFIC